MSDKGENSQGQTSGCHREEILPLPCRSLYGKQLEQSLHRFEDHSFSPGLQVPAWFVIALGVWRARNHLLGLKSWGLVLTMCPHPYNLPTYTLAVTPTRDWGVFIAGVKPVYVAVAHNLPPFPPSLPSPPS